MRNENMSVINNMNFGKIILFPASVASDRTDDSLLLASSFLSAYRRRRNCRRYYLCILEIIPYTRLCSCVRLFCSSFISQFSRLSCASQTQINSIPFHGIPFFGKEQHETGDAYFGGTRNFTNE